jgi:hypothetical protein
MSAAAENATNVASDETAFRHSIERVLHDDEAVCLD